MPNEDLGTGKHGCQCLQTEPSPPPEIYLPNQMCRACWKEQDLQTNLHQHQRDWFAEPRPAIVRGRQVKNTAMPLQLPTQQHLPYRCRRTAPAATHRSRLRNGRAQQLTYWSSVLPPAFHSAPPSRILKRAVPPAHAPTRDPASGAHEAGCLENPEGRAGPSAAGFSPRGSVFLF